MRRALPVLIVVALGGCPQPSVPPASKCEGVRCPGTELCNAATGLCEPRDAGSPDAGLDAGSDAGADAGADAGPGDAGRDAGIDAGLDAGLDAGPDAGEPDAGCGSDNDCLGATPHCRLTTGTCEECLVDAHCLASVAPKCDPLRLACVMCLSNVDCTSATEPVCGALQQCVPCATTPECGPGRECDVLGQCNLLPDACGSERALNLPTGLGTVSFSADPSLALDDATGTCATSSGPELVYRFTTTAVRDLRVVVTPLTGSLARPVVYVRAAPCASGAELSCDAPPFGSAAISAQNLAAGDYFVFVESAGGAQGRVMITVSLTAPAQPPSNDSCSAPQALIFSGTTAAVVDTTFLAANDSSGGPSCSATAQASGADLVYQYTLSALSNVTVTARPVSGSTLHPVVSVRSACGTAASELGCVASTVGQAVTFSLTNQAAGTYFVWLDSADGTSGPFQLEVTALPVVSNDTCAGATALSFSGTSATATGDTSLGTDSSGADLTPSCSTSARAGGKDLVYAYTLTQPRDVTVSVTPTGVAPSYQPVVSVRGACADGSLAGELACVSPLAPATATATLLNQDAGTYFVWVDSAQSTSGPFQLEVIQSAPTPPPLNDTCSGAEVLSFTSDHATVLGTTLQAANDTSPYDVLPTCSPSAKQNGRDVVYAFTLAQPKDVTVTVTPAAAAVPLNPVLFVKKASCTSQLLGDELVCLQRTGAASAELTNLAAGTYFIWVDGAGGTAGNFTLDVQLSAPTAAPPNDDCPGTPLTFAANVATITGTTHGATNSNSPSDNAPSCGDTFLPKRYGRDLVYSYQLGSPLDVDVVVTPAGGSSYVPVIYVRQPGFCANGGAGYEVACVAARQPGPLELSLPNQPAGTYSLFVDSNSYDTGPFTLTVTRRAPTLPPSNDTCAAPGSLTTGVAVQGDTTGALDDYNSLTYGTACQRSFFDGRDLVYRYQATTTGTVTATLTPQGSFDAALLLLTPSCGAAQCVRFSDGAGAGGAEQLSFPVVSGSSYFLVVDSFERTEPHTWGAFSLIVQ